MCTDNGRQRIEMTRAIWDHASAFPNHVSQFEFLFWAAPILDRILVGEEEQLPALGALCLRRMESRADRGAL